MRTTQQMQDEDISGDNPMGLEVYSSDGQLIGRIHGYVDEVPEDEEDFEEGAIDLTDRAGHLLGARRVVIDGQGYVTQAEIAVPLTQLTLDYKGRRATLPLTLAQIEHIPHHLPER